MSYVDELESDFSVYHRVDDFWCRPMDWIARLAPRLPVYGGALHWALERDAQADAPPSPSPAWIPHATQPDDGDTPPEVVAALWRQALVAKYNDMGIDVDGIQEISADEMKAMIDG